jgi:hypothetical protein
LYKQITIVLLPQQAALAPCAGLVEVIQASQSPTKLTSAAGLNFVGSSLLEADIAALRVKVCCGQSSIIADVQICLLPGANLKCAGVIC